MVLCTDPGRERSLMGPAHEHIMLMVPALEYAMLMGRAHAHGHLFMRLRSRAGPYSVFMYCL